MPAIAGRHIFLYLKSCLFHINLQKSLILDEHSSIIILYYCIYLKVRAKNGLKYRTLVLHERNL